MVENLITWCIESSVKFAYSIYCLMSSAKNVAWQYSILYCIKNWINFTDHNQRVCTSREEMGGGWGFFIQIEPNWPLPYSTVPVPLLRDARPAGWVTCYSICASTMPRAQNMTGKGSLLLWRRFTFPIFQYHCWGMLGWRAGSTVSVYAQVQCREPKTGQQKVQSSRKTKYFAYLGI